MRLSCPSLPGLPPAYELLELPIHRRIIVAAVSATGTTPLCLPPFLWGTLAQGVSVGAMVAITTNSERPFPMTYQWPAWQCRLPYLASMTGAVVSIFGCGWLPDITADWLTRRNQGRREPEMRLPALVLSTICGPLSLLLYGFGIACKWHWTVPVLALGFGKFSSSVVLQDTDIDV